MVQKLRRLNGRIRLEQALVRLADRPVAQIVEEIAIETERHVASRQQLPRRAIVEDEPVAAGAQEHARRNVGEDLLEVRLVGGKARRLARHALGRRIARLGQRRRGGGRSRHEVTEIARRIRLQRMRNAGMGAGADRAG